MRNKTSQLAGGSHEQRLTLNQGELQSVTLETDAFELLEKLSLGSREVLLFGVIGCHWFVQRLARSLGNHVAVDTAPHDLRLVVDDTHALEGAAHIIPVEIA